MTANTHQSLQRAVAIMREFTELEPALTVSEISRRLGLHKSTVSRILAALAEEGMVWHNADTGRYSLGMALVEMAGVALGQIDVRAAAMPRIERLSAETNETITVVVNRGREGITVAHLPSTHPIRHVVWIGRRIPLRTTAAGRVLLAAMHVRGEVDGETTLATDLGFITKRGYAEESDEYEIGTSAIAAPVLDYTGEAVAALSISGPSARFDSKARNAAVPLLIEVANEVAADLGMRRHERKAFA